ncbi:MAG: hypothetical protein NDI60_02300 [Elusimicrobiales bacterium]|nr:hypothetical protein [Elusimicrobiales bacterium]
MTENRDRNKRLRPPPWLAAGALLLLPSACLAGDLTAVLSVNTGPYAEAYLEFKAEMGEPFTLFDLSQPGEVPTDETRHTAAFGAKAAALDYPQGAHIVYALAPVALRGRGFHEISMVPAPGPALAAYKAFQPGLRRLAVFWTAYPGEDYISDLREAGKAAGIEVISSKLKNPEAFPERLRRLMGKMDAFWLMPDPALITQSSIMLLASFSCANGIPFYAPTSALVGSGATASYAPEFAQAGAAAARALRTLHKGDRLPQVTYVEDVRLRVNKVLPEKCRWPVAAR